jgi:predicted outer membrane protein
MWTQEAAAGRRSGRPGRLRRRLLATSGVGLLAVAGLWLLPLSGTAGAAALNKGLPTGWTMTATGPLGPADRDLLVRVRQAGLWEGPAGQMAQGRAASDRVKEVGQHLATDHAALDVQVRAVAAQLAVTLPDAPTAEQQGWLNELSSKQGKDFDQVFADRLRAAHGKVFAIVATVRAGTRNNTIREFAQTANTVVMKHMTLLESTGLVDFDALPTAAPVVAAPVAGTARLTGNSAAGINPSLVWLVLGIAAVVGLVTAVRVVRPR